MAAPKRASPDMGVLGGLDPAALRIFVNINIIFIYLKMMNINRQPT